MVKSLKIMSLGTEVILIKSQSMYHAYIMDFSLTLWPLENQPATRLVTIG